MPDEFSNVIAAANETLAEVKRLCEQGLIQWNDDKNAPPGARVINGTYTNYVVVVAEIPVEGRVQYSGMVAGPRLAATVMPVDLCKLCYETGSKAIAASGA